jgi:hypothetical protein
MLQSVGKHDGDGRLGWLDVSPDIFIDKGLGHVVSHLEGRQRGEPLPINGADGSEPHIVHAAADLLIAVALIAIERGRP